MECLKQHLQGIINLAKEDMEKENLSEDSPVLQNLKKDAINELKILNQKYKCGVTDLKITEMVDKSFAHQLGVD
jgi:hypothetical protein